MRRVLIRDEHEKLTCVLLIQNPVDSTHRLTGSVEANVIYKTSIQDNITLLTKSIGASKFELNKRIFNNWWKVYYQNMLLECNY